MSHPYTREYWDEGTIGYKMYRDFPSHWRIVKIILEKKPESVLDVGGARGYIAKKLKANGVRAVCMDISENAWHNRAIDSFIRHDARNVPWQFKDKEFDLCMTTSFMEHLTEPEIEVVIKEMARVSKRGYHTITFEKTPQDIDITHRTFKPHEWWMGKFKEYAPDYPVEIMTKEQAMALEQSPIILPEKDQLVKLNIGCFTDMFYYGWKNVDVIDLTQWAKLMGYDFIHADVKDGIKMVDDSVDLIVASHFLEHLTREEGAKFLAECYRVLKPDGVLRLAVPDAKLLAYKYINGTIMEYRHVNIGVEKAPDFAEAFFHLLLAGHKTIYDSFSLEKALKNAGFDHPETKSPFESTSRVIELQTISMYPTLSLYTEGKKHIQNVKKTSETKSEIPASTHVEVTEKAPETSKSIAYYNKDKLKIALFSTPLLTVPPVNYGGLEMIVADLGRELACLGHDVTIFAPKGSKVEGCRIFEVGDPVQTVFVDWLQMETNMFEVSKVELMTGGYDIIHGHNWFGMEYRAKALDPKLHVLHTHHGGLSDWWTKTKAPFKLNMVGISEWMKSVYEGQGIPTRAVHNGVNLDKYPLHKEKSDRYLYLSRIAFFKAPHLAIKIAKELGIKLDVAGATKFVDDANYVEEVKRSCDGEQIRFIGEVTNEQKLELLQKAKALLVTGRWGEPFGLHVVEALSTGTEVIAVADGGIKETLKQGGVLCQDIETMKYELEHFKPIPPTVCRNNASLFSTKEMAKAYLNAYRDVLQGKEW